jgi:hypothetical protein
VNRKVLMVAVMVVSSCGRHRLADCRRFPDLEPAVCEQSDGGIVVMAAQSLSFGPEGLSSILVNGRDLYFVDRQGKTMSALHFDNGPDYFVEGLARIAKAGKAGFVNTRLEPVVPPVWDFAFPFDHGVARLCTGCVAQRGEHATVTGGRWGYIDNRGTVVLPVVYDLAALPARW